MNDKSISQTSKFYTERNLTRELLAEVKLLSFPAKTNFILTATNKKTNFCKMTVSSLDQRTSFLRSVTAGVFNCFREKVFQEIELSYRFSFYNRDFRRKVTLGWLTEQFSS